MKARTLLKKLIDHGFTVQLANDKIRLSPRHLINDKVLAFVRLHKNDLICALHGEHQEKKDALNQGRLHVLRCLIRRYLKPSVPDRIIPTDHEIEDFIDSALQRHDYDIEDVITTYRSIVPEPKIIYAQCIYCGYMKPFCGC